MKEAITRLVHEQAIAEAKKRMSREIGLPITQVDKLASLLEAEYGITLSTSCVMSQTALPNNIVRLSDPISPYAKFDKYHHKKKKK